MKYKYRAIFKNQKSFKKLIELEEGKKKQKAKRYYKIRFILDIAMLCLMAIAILVFILFFLIGILSM